MSDAPTRDDALALDAADPLGAFVDRFVVTDPDLCYLNGNSLGRLPRATVDRLRTVVEHEWGDGLVRSWEEWIDRPQRVGDVIAPLIGAAPGQVIVNDSTTHNLYALLDAACAARPGRRRIVVADDEFPTDRYVAAGVAAARGLELRGLDDDPIEGVDAASVVAACDDDDVAVVLVSAVDFRSGALLDIEAIVAAVHAAGALLCLDLSHAVGVIPVELDRLGVDLAVGCTYKYLCGGPGAPAFLYVRHDLQSELRPPVWGWFAQQDQFAMGSKFAPHIDIRRFLVGTPSIVGLAAVEEGARLVAEAGLDAIRRKAVALGKHAVTLADARLAPLGFALASPRDPERRGSHVALAHPEALGIGAALRDQGVVPDVRPPDRLRLGLAPLTTTFVEIWDAVDRLARLVGTGGQRGSSGKRRVP